LHAVDAAKRSPLYWACQQNCEEIAWELLRFLDRESDSEEDGARLAIRRKEEELEHLSKMLQNKEKEVVMLRQDVQVARFQHRLCKAALQEKQAKESSSVGGPAGSGAAPRAEGGMIEKRFSGRVLFGAILLTGLLLKARLL